MLNKRCYRLLFRTLMAFFMLQIAHAQSEWSLTPGFYYNGGWSTMDVGGFGPIAGLEYKPTKTHFFSLELRTKYGFYFFNDGTEWVTDENGNKLLPPLNNNEARVDYKLFTPRIGLVPKLHLRFDKPLSLFLENELDIGLMTGKIKYFGFGERKRITEPIYCYSVGVGFEFKGDRDKGGPHLVLSMGYSTLNFINNIKKHRPTGYNVEIPNQRAPFYMNLVLKFPLKCK